MARGTEQGMEVYAIPGDPRSVIDLIGFGRLPHHHITQPPLDFSGQPRPLAFRLIYTVSIQSCQNWGQTRVYILELDNRRFV